MIKFYRALAFAVVLSGLVGCQAPTLKVVSVSLPAAEDRTNWLEQRDLLLEFVKAREPDVIAIQGATAIQYKLLFDALTDYTGVATGAEDGAAGGDLNPLFIRNGRLQIADQGHFWLSKTPGEVGSRDWDAREPRVATWVRVKTLSPLTSTRIMNTRFDPDGPESRQRSAEIVRRYAEAMGSEGVIVLGDFGDGRRSRVYQILTEDYRFTTPMKDVLVEAGRRGVAAGDSDDDAVSRAAPSAAGNRRSARKNPGGDMVDHMLVNRPVEVLAADAGWLSPVDGALRLGRQGAPRAGGADTPAWPDAERRESPTLGYGVIIATLRPPTALYQLAP